MDSWASSVLRCDHVVFQTEDQVRICWVPVIVSGGCLHDCSDVAGAVESVSRTGLRASRGGASRG